jgi:hypothetical protein
MRHDLPFAVLILLFVHPGEGVLGSVQSDSVEQQLEFALSIGIGESLRVDSLCEPLSRHLGTSSLKDLHSHVPSSTHSFVLGHDGNDVDGVVLQLPLSNLEGSLDGASGWIKSEFQSPWLIINIEVVTWFSTISLASDGVVNDSFVIKLLTEGNF